MGDNMKSVFPFCLIFLVPLSVIIGYHIGDIYTYLTLFTVFGAVPVLDLVIGFSKKNPDAREETAWNDKLSFKLLPILCAPLQVISVLWGAYVVSEGTLSYSELSGFMLSMGISSGVTGINVAHELQHRVNLKLEPFLARIMLWTVMYMHWAIEHVAGHHKNVATPEDPATARLGESFYAFWPRTVGGGFKDAWKIESARLKRNGQNMLCFNNRFILFLAFEFALCFAILAIFGLLSFAYFIIQSLIAITLLEVVNYVEHYGLLRNKDAEGRYEPVTFLHSWNSSNWLTNRFLINLQRHSDHHYKPGRRYQLLRHFDESPQLPTGYAGMVLLAAVPPLWRKVMDPRVKEFRTTGEHT
jgi:alkane 1-monooxygenase